MNQIAIGDSSGWTVIEGQSVATPFRHTAVFFVNGDERTVREKLAIQLAGSPGQISAAVTRLEDVRLRTLAYAEAAYARPQLLRFQPLPGGAYYYAKIDNLVLDATPDGYISHQRGSLLVQLQYTRAHYFDGDPTELPLSGRTGTDLLGGIDLVNHTDGHSAHGNTALVKASAALTDLPAPLRVEIENTTATPKLKDILIGGYHHPSTITDGIFFINANQMTGGSQFANPSAINEYYRTVTWTASTWTPLLSAGVMAADIAALDGRTYRPILHLYNAHAYTDLHLKLQLKRGAFILQSCEPVYADPDYDHVMFPPVQLPPNQLLRETLPHHVEIQVEGLKEDGSPATLSIDQLTLLPMDICAVFRGFYPMAEDDTLIDDSFRGLSNVRYSAAGSETIAHIRLGRPLLLYPNENTRLVFVLVNESNAMDIMRTVKVRVYYRPRVRIL